MAKKTLSQKIDHLCSVLFLTEEGKPKSATLLYSFCVSLLFIVIYFFSYFLMIDPLENLFSGASTQARYAVQVVIPAIVGSIPCALLSYAFKEEKKNIVPSAFRWMGFGWIALMILGIFFFDPGDYISFFSIFGITGFLSVICGGFAAGRIYRSRK